MIRQLLAGTVALTSCFVLTPGFAEDVAKPSEPALAIKTVEGACQNCHGEKGSSISPTFPRLNGQQADYLAAQIKAFRDHSRGDPHAQAYMWGMASSLDDALIGDLAKYYAGQLPTPPQSGGALAAEGKKIFTEGVEKDHIPPCQACHGEHGEGDGTTPRIAGQHGDYLIKQLEAFRSLLRQNEIMHANTKDMTDSQIAAIVSYLAND